MDFVQAWNHMQQQEPRSVPEHDQHFWSQHAHTFDQRDNPTPQTVKWLKTLLPPGSSLLDLGAGTGRFSLPLAPGVSRVTAVDHSPHMLQVLQDKQASQGIQNVGVLQGDHHHLPLTPHDTVLAAWVLYSSRNLEATLRRMASLARLQVVVLDDDGTGSPHRRLLNHWRGKSQRTRPSKPELLAGAWRQLGFDIQHTVIQEHHSRVFPSVEVLLERLFPAVPAEDREGLWSSLHPFLSSCDQGVLYRYPFEVHALRVPIPAQVD